MKGLFWYIKSYENKVTIANFWNGYFIKKVCYKRFFAYIKFKFSKSEIVLDVKLHKKLLGIFWDHTILCYDSDFINLCLY